MVAELDWLEEWIPEQMAPGTMFLLERPSDQGENPYLAVLACPRCGCLGLITKRQCAGRDAMICGGDACSAEYRLLEGTIEYRQPH